MSGAKQTYREINPEQSSITILLPFDVAKTLSGANVYSPGYDDARQHKHKRVGNMFELLPAQARQTLMVNQPFLHQSPR